MKGVTLNKGAGVKRITGFLLLICMFMSCIIPAYASQNDNTHRTIRVAYAVSAHESNVAGFTREFMDKLSEYTGWKLEYIACEADERGEANKKAMELVSRGEADIMGPVIKSEVSENPLRFPEKSCGVVYTTLFSPEFTEINIYNPRSDGRTWKVAVYDKDAARTREVSSYLKSHDIPFELVECTSVDEQLEAVEKGTADVMAGSSIQSFPNTRTAARFSPKPCYMVMTPGNSELIKQFDKGMKAFMTAQPFFLDGLADEYFDRNTIEFDPNEVDDSILPSDGVVDVLGIDSDAPFFYTEKDGSPAGFMYEILKGFAEATGQELNVVICPSVYDREQYLKSGKYDFLVGSPFNSDLCTDIGYVQSSTIVTETLSEIYRIGEDLGNPDNIMAVVYNSHVQKENEADNTVVFNNVPEIIEAIEKGKADIAYVDTACANYYIKELYSDLESNVLFDRTVNITAAIDHELPSEYISLFNRYIRSIDNNQKTQMLQEAGRHDAPNLFRRFTKKHPVLTVVIPMMTVSIIVLAISLLIYRKKKKEYSETIRKSNDDLEDYRKKLVEQIESGREWEYHAEHDALTGLLNRKAYDRIAEKLNSEKTAVCFALIDIDHFKEINDDYGHEEGDKLLAGAAKVINKHIRETDYAFRFGGDEFLLLLCGAEVDHMPYIVKRIHEMSEQLENSEDLPTASFSAGLFFSTEGINDAVYRLADEALYNTKKNGKNGCSVIDKDKNIIFEHHEDSKTSVQMPKSIILNNIKTGTWRIEMPDDGAAKMFCDEPMLEFLGLNRLATPEECYNRWFENIDKEHLPYVLEAVDTIIATGKAEITYKWHMPGKGALTVRCGGTFDPDYRFGRCLYGTHQDVSDMNIVTYIDEKKRIELEKDHVTEELNMQGFIRKAGYAIGSMSGEFTMLHFDINGFKAVNDQIGFERGNYLLKKVAGSIKRSQLKPVLITRGTADHFYCLIRRENVDYKEIVRVCRQGVIIGDTSIVVTLKCGVYNIDDKEQPIRLMCDKARMAENAVDEENGSIPYCVFTNEMKQEYIRRQAIIASLDDAVNNGEIHTYYQPVYDSRTGKIVSAEALVRWVKADGQVISPNDFIPTLEENGQVSRIDMVISDHVREFIGKRLKNGSCAVPVSVNLSRIDFYNEEAMEHLITSIKNASIPKGYLRYEITESAYSDIPEQGAEVIRKLREYGAKLLIDDFGKGYSSLGSLAEQMFDIVKLDMSFIRKIGENDRTEAVIKASIDMAHMMNAAVIAEGVETKEQFDFLREKGCDYIQGYYFSKPLPESEFEELMDKEVFNITKEI